MRITEKETLNRMDFNELHKKYQELLIENNNLKEEIKRLKACPDDAVPDKVENIVYPVNHEQNNTVAENFLAGSAFITKRSDSAEKIRLFMSLFRGRDDVYAKRWENKKKGTAGYSPVCANEWKPDSCRKPQIKCTDCNHKSYLPFTDKVAENHLRGRDNLIAGIYPLCNDETCWFLSIDFDDDGWQRDISTIRDVCSEFKIPLSVERSRSGNGAHAWFFFKEPVAATFARKFGSALLTYAMNQRHELSFSSYDRLFPNQNTMPKGGFGNLIALPLQKAARKNGNSVFIDEEFNPLQDQWAYLSSLRKISEADMETWVAALCRGNELGQLKEVEEEDTKPWETTPKVELQRNDFPEKMEVIEANMLFIPKAGLTQRAMNHLKRLAAFKNPEFYRAQAMRLSTYDKPRIISCADETAEYLCLPRGCEADLTIVFEELNIEVNRTDKTNQGKKIHVEFTGNLRKEQSLAVDKILEHDTGVLCGTTAFGKTVAAIKLIAEKKVNTLIMVDKINLVSQWKERLEEFLLFREASRDGGKPDERNKKKKRSIIGQIGGGKNTLTGTIDIAIMQSLNRAGKVKDFVKNYGMVIVDECHHVSAFSFETILKQVSSRYVYGLTATPVRKDGHHPIIFMQCGPIRYRDDALKQAKNRPFEHFNVPRFTSFRPSFDKRDIPIYELYNGIATNKLRNQLITDDVVQCHKKGRNCIVLTERTAHVKLIAEELEKRIPDVITATGGMGVKKTRETMIQIANMPPKRPLTLIATGRYIGEGFDEPRLDTLFLAMPISWKGTLQQYAGRLHRLYKGKKEVLIYDYVDIH
ncbi:MAG: DEAD/DEAH box helicase family protein, partial [Bacteroidales bacterium]